MIKCREHKLKEFLNQTEGLNIKSYMKLQFSVPLLNLGIFPFKNVIFCPQINPIPQVTFRKFWASNNL